MLVKFLSFVASVLGTARYKAVLLSAFAIVISLTGVTAVAVFRDSSGKNKSASSTVNAQGDDATANSAAPQLGNTPKQLTKSTSDEPQSQSQSAAPNPNSSSQSDDKSSAGSTQAKTPASDQPAVDITLTPDHLTLAAGTQSDELTASTTDNSAVTWTVAPVDNSDKGVHAVIIRNSSAILSYRLQADSDATSGTQVHLKVTARDTSRNVNVSKSITVTIQ